MIPLANMEDFLPSKPDPRYAASQFFSLSRELVVTTVKKIAEVYMADPHFHKRCFDIAFGHEASQKASEVLVKHLHIPPGIYYSVHPRYGNCVSASVPARHEPGPARRPPAARRQGPDRRRQRRRLRRLVLVYVLTSNLFRCSFRLSIGPFKEQCLCLVSTTHAACWQPPSVWAAP